MWKETTPIYLAVWTRSIKPHKQAKTVSWKALTYGKYIWNDLKNKYPEKGSHHADNIKIF